MEHGQQRSDLLRRVVPANVQDKIEEFLDLLMLWNSRINLVATRDRLVIRHRHVEDSLQLAPLLTPADGSQVDLGSGAGFPGLMLALMATRPIHLIEADRRKAAFLLEAAARLDLPHVTVHARRIEQVTVPDATVLTARALAPVCRLLPHVERLLRPGGIAVFPKGQAVALELEEARRDWTFDEERFTSRTDPSATILRLSNVRRVGQA